MVDSKDIVNDLLKMFEFIPYILRSDGLYECPWCGTVVSRTWLETFGRCCHCDESERFYNT